MRPNHHSTISSHPRYNNPNLQNPGHQLDATSLLFGRDELDKPEILIKTNGLCGHFGIDKLLLLFERKAAEEHIPHQSTQHYF